MDWTTTMHANGFFTSFPGITYMSAFLEEEEKELFACMVVLQSVGKSTFSSSKYGTDLSLSFDTIEDLLLWIGKQPCMPMDF